MARIQKLRVLTIYFSPLHRHNIHCQQRKLSKFLTRYQQLASHAYCGAAGPVSKMASQQKKAFCLFRFDSSRSVITVQREFRARFKMTLFLCGAYFLDRALTLHCNHRSGHLKTEHTEGLLLLRSHLGNLSRGPAVSMRSELLEAHERLDSSRC
jgi:hypothetical protein